MKTINEILLVFFNKEEADKIISTEFTSPQNAVSSMWYIKVLIGVSAWFASLSFLMAASVLLKDMENTGVILGIILCLVAVILNYFYHKKVFVQQFALALCLAGQAAATLYFSQSDHSSIQTYIFSIVISALIVVAYQYSVMRFFAVQALVISVVLLIEEIKWQNGVSFLMVIITIGVCILWIFETDFAVSSMAPVLRTCTYALTFSLLAIPVLSTHNFFNWESPNWMLATIGVAIIFVFAQGKMFSSFNKSLVSPAFIATSVLTAGLTAITFNSPGIITALFVMMLGFSRGNKILTVLAGFCLGAYIIMFYYNLSITLLYKSYTLMGSGALLMVAWAVFTRFKGGSAK